MNASTPPAPHVAAPGTERPRRFRPKLRYELIGCGLHGHEILGTDAAALRPEDELFARDSGGLRWYRCMRCDSWLALPPPDHPARKYPPAREEISLPLRGKPLRDRYVLRLIAVDRILHFLVLAALATAVLLFASDRAALNAEFTKILNDLQGGVGGPTGNSTHGIIHDLRYLFAVRIQNLYLVGAAIAAYALLDAGTTTARIAAQLPADRELVVVTNSVPVAARLAAMPSVSMQLLGAFALLALLLAAVGT